MIADIRLYAMKTESEANRHTHWRDRQRRAKEQRATAYYALRKACGQHTPMGRYRITLTRIAPRMLDSDNLQGSLKHIRDGVADWLGIDDGSPRLQWDYGQVKGTPKTYGVQIVIAADC